ncbi:hypothetical protein RHGRI_006655 [Rhododendron griersonianum]|uniref:Uncharacterized protein n=1 Tax=Rhododendron griersonianum TaxID=479676 RepID=A0AAV6KTW3_9ERIC|nr:hypothetical protein RHGRI_006655 [Rhododendron griersonianum]
MGGLRTAEFGPVVRAGLGKAEEAATSAPDPGSLSKGVADSSSLDSLKLNTAVSKGLQKSRAQATQSSSTYDSSFSPANQHGKHPPTNFVKLLIDGSDYGSPGEAAIEGVYTEH